MLTRNRTDDLVSIAQHWAQARPDSLLFSYSADGETESQRLTFAELDARARAIAATLQAAGAEDRCAMLIYAGDASFFAGFLGCLYARVVAVPIPVGRALPARVAAIVEDCAPVMALSTEEHAQAGRMAFALHPRTASIPWLATDTVDGERAADWRQPRIGGATLAYLQYTSGSTAEPKGVMISHGNILANLRYIHETYQVDDESISVSWLPHFHDMGLIQGYLEPLLAGRPSYVFAPRVFVKQPLTWLRAISRHRATHSGAPNFAFQLCVDAVEPAAREELDLSSWRAAYTGAEPVQPATLAAFAGAFAPSGFRATALRPCYGLAEATLLVTSSDGHYTDSILHLDRAALAADRVAAAVPEAPGCAVVGCGPARGDTSVAIVHPVTGERRGDGEVGEIWVSGPGVSSGYWNRDDLNERVFRARLPGDPRAYLRTGDLGFSQRGELYIAGRVDDLIIIYGRNLYPNDIELTVVGSHRSLSPSGAGVFGVSGEHGTRIGVVAELRREEQQGFEGDAIAAAIRRAVAEQHEVQVDHIALLPAGKLPRTTSGKPRRANCRQLLLAGELPCLYQSRATGEADALGGIAALAGSLREGSREAAEAHAVAELRRYLAPVVGVATEQLDEEFTIAGLGLDSLQQVQLRNRIEAAFGLALPVDLSDMTLRQLAGELVDRARAPAQPGQPAETPPGPVPLSPLQRGFLRSVGDDIDHINLSMMLEASVEVPVSALVAAVTAVVAREESLALRHERTAAGWVQRYDGPDDAIVSTVDLRAIAEGERSAAIERHAAEVQGSLDIARGPLARAVVFDLGPGVAARLLVVAHWLAVDALSMRILFDRIQLAVDQRLRAESTPIAPASFVRWARQRAVPWSEEELAADLAFWSATAARVPPALPLELSGGNNDFTSSREVTGVFGADQTTAILAAASARGATMADLLAAAYARAVVAWSGHPRALIGVTTHGRDEASGGLVGRIAGGFPALLETSRSSSGGAALDDLLGQLRAIPRGGASFSFLGSRDPGLARLAHPELQLDYLGGLYADLTGRSRLRPAVERSGPDFAPNHKRPFTLRLSGFVLGSRLSLTLDYSVDQLRPETAEALFETIRTELLGFLSP
jgi:acyl-CoA synthetase (AMP-forming)/AMP-acid ligase II